MAFARHQFVVHHALVGDDRLSPSDDVMFIVASPCKATARALEAY